MADVTKGRQGLAVNAPVFWTSVGLILLFVVLVLWNHEDAEAAFATAQTRVATNAGWFFVLTANLMLAYAIYLAVGRYGRIRLGGPRAIPEFSWPAWFSMLFSAGMGIGLVFYAVAEPLLHYTRPPVPPATGVASHTLAQEAMGLTFLHWGLHPWAIYSVLGLMLAFMAFNRDRGLSLRSIFQPLFRERIEGWIGHAIDIVATLATLFGVATSLGLGVSQVNAGLSEIVDMPQTIEMKLLLIAGITFVATLSVVSGIKAGIRRLSELNMILAGILLFFIIVMGPTIFIFNGFFQNVGYYLQNFARLATWNETYTGTEWQNSWTIFYYAWWISWSPFVAMFIARISRGRTIREFVTGVLLVPTTIGFFWLTVFGDSALQIQMAGDTSIGDMVQSDVTQAMFAFLAHFPLSIVSSILVTLVVITFFVTSSDSGSLVIDMITSGGHLNPPVGQRIFWATTEGVVAAVLMLGGGLVALQTASILTGLPFAVVLLVGCYSFTRALEEEVSDQHTPPEQGSA